MPMVMQAAKGKLNDNCTILKPGSTASASKPSGAPVKLPSFLEV